MITRYLTAVRPGVSVPDPSPKRQRGVFLGKPGVSVAVLSAAMLPALSGCVQLAALWATTTGGDRVEAEYELTKGPLLILIDDRTSLVTEPQALRRLHKALSGLFLEQRVNRNVVPFSDWQHLQQSDRRYDRLSIRQIGERLGAEQVLYLDVERFTLRAEPGAPLFKGEFAVRVKVLSTEHGDDVRLWPREASGRRVSATTEPIPTDGEKTAGDVAKELAAKLAESVAKLFYGHRDYKL